MKKTIIEDQISEETLEEFFLKKVEEKKELYSLSGMMVPFLVFAEESIINNDRDKAVMYSSIILDYAVKMENSILASEVFGELASMMSMNKIIAEDSTFTKTKKTLNQNIQKGLEVILTTLSFMPEEVCGFTYLIEMYAQLKYALIEGIVDINNPKVGAINKKFSDLENGISLRFRGEYINFLDKSIIDLPEPVLCYPRTGPHLL